MVAPLNSIVIVEHGQPFSLLQTFHVHATAKSVLNSGNHNFLDKI